LKRIEIRTTGRLGKEEIVDWFLEHQFAELEMATIAAQWTNPYLEELFSLLRRDSPKLAELAFGTYRNVMGRDSSNYGKQITLEMPLGGLLFSKLRVLHIRFNKMKWNDSFADYDMPCLEVPQS
jgi:hypothetical protein